MLTPVVLIETLLHSDYCNNDTRTSLSLFIKQYIYIKKPTKLFRRSYTMNYTCQVRKEYTAVHVILFLLVFAHFLPHFGYLWGIAIISAN